MINQNNQKEIYTTSNLAELFQVSERTILEHIRSNELKAYKRFKKWYVKHSDLLDFLTSSETNESQTETENQ